jgi:uncharacterized oligopeptide transporter (OPT) family protein
MQEKIIKFVGYSILGIIILSVCFFIPFYISVFALCGGCFLTIYGPKIVFIIYIISAVYLLFNMYQKIFQPKEKEKFSIIMTILLVSAACFVISFAIIIGGDLLNIGGPYDSF